MSSPSAEDLHSALQTVLRRITLTLEALQNILNRYPDEESLPMDQDNKFLNTELRALGLEISKPLRAELVICQIMLMTWFKTPFLRSAEDLCLSYGFRHDEVVADRNLGEFVWYMEYAVILVSAKGHMDFLINDVVAPLSEKLSGRRYPAGGGSESIGTVMRFAVFEKETGYVRPKSRQVSASGDCSEPAAALVPQQHPLVASKKRLRRSRKFTFTLLRGTNVPVSESTPALHKAPRRDEGSTTDSLSESSGGVSNWYSEDNFLELIDLVCEGEL
jgi:hypothetical protein